MRSSSPHARSAGALAVALKRLTYRKLGPVRLEAYFTFKPEASELRLSETDVRAVGVLFDLQDVDKPDRPAERIMPHIRYLNALDGEPVGRWQFKAQTRIHARHRRHGQDQVALSSCA